jgi:hypothetical protein
VIPDSNAITLLDATELDAGVQRLAAQGAVVPAVYPLFSAAAVGGLGAVVAAPLSNPPTMIPLVIFLGVGVAIVGASRFRKRRAR